MDKKVLVLYKSKYGATKKYADILKTKMNGEVFNIEDNKGIDFKNYDAVILAGGIYGNGIAGIKYLKNNYEVIKDKKLAIFSVGASPYDEKALEEIKAKNLQGDLENIPLFYGRGAWDESIMNFKDKILSKLLRLYVKSKDPNTLEPWMKSFFESLGKKCDWVDEEYLTPLIDYIRQ